MKPLDLTQQPPRGPRDLLPGLNLLMAARTVDKFGLRCPAEIWASTRLRALVRGCWRAIGIGEAALRAAIAAATDDEAVAKWIREHSDPAIYAEFNRKLEALTGRRALKRLRVYCALSAGPEPTARNAAHRPARGRRPRDVSEGLGRSTRPRRASRRVRARSRRDARSALRIRCRSRRTRREPD